MALLTAEVTCLWWLLEHFWYFGDYQLPLSDSIGTISIMHDPVRNELTKHTVVDPSFTRSRMQDQVVALQYVPSEYCTTSSRRPRLEHGTASSSLC
jgi:hypothetical protein